MTTPAQAAVAALARPAVPPTDMTKPVQPAVPSPARLSNRGRGDELESWFDEQLRPVLLRYLAEVDRQHQDHQKAAFASIRHWLNELPGRAHQHGKETQAFAKAMAGELRGRLGDEA